MLEQYDVMLAMYHDQGLPVLKHHGFGRAANITLGLPFVRTSVDHGTAFDIAGTGCSGSWWIKNRIGLCHGVERLMDDIFLPARKGVGAKFFA